jgi:hypothetical protein
MHRGSLAALAAVAIVLLSGCTATSGTETSTSPPPPTASAPTEPTIEITYEIDGRTETALSHPDKKSCSNGSLIAFSDAEVASVATLPAEDDASAQISAYVLDDLYVGFVGRGSVEVVSTEDGGSRASVLDLEGTATLVEIPDGPRPSAGELDLSTGTEVPAALTATVVCPS